MAALTATKLKQVQPGGGTKTPSTYRDTSKTPPSRAADTVTYTVKSVGGSIRDTVNWR